jgi:hypothetical protein
MAWVWFWPVLTVILAANGLYPYAALSAVWWFLNIWAHRANMRDARRRAGAERARVEMIMREAVQGAQEEWQAKP